VRETCPGRGDDRREQQSKDQRATRGKSSRLELGLELELERREEES
jgi:hypothetical protein